MARHLNYNPGRDSIEYLEAITCGENRWAILDQLLISLRAEIGRPNHQHHLLIGPRGSGKTHLLRLLTAGRIPQEPALAAAYLPVVMPEETPLRSPGDLFLKFVERLADLLNEPPTGIPLDTARAARGVCMTALTTAKGIRAPLDRLEVMAAALEAAAKTLGRIILPIAENMDQTFYLGAQRSRTGPLDEQWALRRHLQESPHLFLIAAAPCLFGAVGDPGKPFYDFFRTHELRELSNDEVLKIIRVRLEREAAAPASDGMRDERVHRILNHFDEKSPQIRGLLAITGGLPRFTHLTYEVVVETDVDKILDTLNGFLDDLTPYFQHRLDPRVIPQAEIDLLHTLALARGPQQPSELAEALYGVQTNEISELLGRLQERGMVKRAGRPGGQAVTWDLTEPLYRVWTQFRDNPDGQDMYRLLGKFVALLFERDEIVKEREALVAKLSLLPDGHDERIKLHSRKRLVDNAYEWNIASCIAEKALGETVMYGTGHSEKAGDSAPLLLEELRQLSQAHPEDAALREQLAKGLFNAINNARDAGDRKQGLALLEELRQLSHAHPEDAALREWLAKGLSNAFKDAGEAGDRGRGLALLEELRRLSHAHPEDAALREPLAVGLFNAFIDAGKAGDRGQGLSLLEELRQLSHAHPEDAARRKRLAMGLVNASSAAGEAGDREQGLALLEELRQLSHAHPEDAALREWLSNGLFNAIHYAGNAGDREQGLALLEELRQLSHAHPEDATLRERLARRLASATIYAGKAGDREQELALREELFDLLERCQGASVESMVSGVVMMYGRSLLSRMKAGNTTTAKEDMGWLGTRLPSGTAEMFRPMMLAMDVLVKGEEQALAREPEEVRRVVRMVLEKLE